MLRGSQDMLKFSSQLPNLQAAAQVPMSTVHVHETFVLGAAAADAAAGSHVLAVIRNGIGERHAGACFGNTVRCCR